MHPISLHVLSAVALLAIFCSTSTGHQVTLESEKSHTLANSNFLARDKRDIETFDEAYSTASSPDAQEEPGFWDRVVKVALKLFSKFMDWLNSSN